MELAYICTKEAMVEIEKRGRKAVLPALRESLAKGRLSTDEHVVTLCGMDGGVEYRYKVVTGIVSIEEEEGGEGELG